MLFRNGNDQQFFGLLKSAAANICKTASLFAEMVERLDQRAEYAERIKGLESEGDRFTQGLTNLLNSVFITPLEREDILALAHQLDDVVDGIEKAAARIDIYRINAVDEHVRTFVGLIRQQADEIVAAMDRLPRREFVAIREGNARIRTYEKEADVVLRRALSELFSGRVDPTELIKLKEIYETLEETTDQAESVANTLESVVVKNA
ncbi:MAG: DUF47 domain-containing protein [Mycobacterium leprae]